MDYKGRIMSKLVSTESDVSDAQLLTDEQLNFYWDYGYLVIKNLYDTPLIDLFRDRFVEIVNMPDAGFHYSIVKDPKLRAQNVDPEMYVNKIQELLYDPVYCQYSEAGATLRVVSRLLGPRLTAINCMLINKPAGTQQHSPHQDLYYFPIRPADKIVAVWTAVDRATRDNGCIYVIPGSHKIETLYVHGETTAEKKQLFHGILLADVAPEEKRVYLEMEPGDTVFFHPYLVHGSGANTSQRYRKAMTAHFANSDCHYIDVRGTPQEVLSAEMEKEIQRRGAEFSFVDIWRMKSKQVRGVRSNL